MHLEPLKEGDPIGIAAPAGPLVRGGFREGVRRLRKGGFRIRYRRDIFSRNGFLAGDDRRRSAELNDFLKSPRIKALLFARGGYGTQRLLPSIGKVSPKIVVGSSDLTVLLAYLWKRFRMISLYGPMVATHLRHRSSALRLKRVLTSVEALTNQSLVAKNILHPGRARGRLLGGCLTLVASLIGTPNDLETRNAILFLEDTDEPPYAVDRLLTQLEQAGKFRGVRGIVFGTFRLKGKSFPQEIERVVRQKMKKFRGPILWGVPFGHCADPRIIPFGGIGRIEGKRLKIERGIFDAPV